jgi:E3 ubiquitin-protein ligase BRE1
MQARASAEKKEPTADDAEEPKPVAPLSPVSGSVNRWEFLDHSDSLGFVSLMRRQQPQANGDGQVKTVDESDVWQELAQTRENKIMELEHETAILRDEINILRLEVRITLGKPRPRIESSLVEAPSTRIDRRNTIL